MRVWLILNLKYKDNTGVRKNALYLSNQVLEKVETDILSETKCIDIKCLEVNMLRDLHHILLDLVKGGDGILECDAH